MFPRLHSASRNPSRRRFRREPRTLGRHSTPAPHRALNRAGPIRRVRLGVPPRAALQEGGSPPWGTRGSPSYRNSRVGRAGRVPRSRSSGSRRSAGRRDAGLQYPCLHAQRSYFMFFLQTHTRLCAVYRDARDEFYLFFLACTSAVMHISCTDAYEYMRKFSMFT